MRRLIVAVLAFGLLAVGLTGSPLQASAAPGGGFSGEDFPVTLRWSSCFEQFGPTFECATVRVPLDYDNLRGRRIPIELVRLPATGESRGSLFLNPGGPGDSGIDLVVGAGPVLYGLSTADIRAEYDLIGFDPRGIIRSSPLLCFDTLDAAVNSQPSFAFPVTREEQKLQRQAGRLLRKQCRKFGGVITDHMSTANVARDLEMLRAAVGDENLNYAGYSYGTVLGQVYANLFPDRVGHLIIDGVADVRDWVGSRSGRSKTTLEDRVDFARGSEDTFVEFLRLCDEAGPDRCPVGPNAVDRVHDILDRLQDEPFVQIDPSTGEVLLKITYADVVDTILQTLYASSAWSELSFVLADVESLLSGSGAAISALDQDVDSLLTVEGADFGRNPESGEDPRYRNLVEGPFGVACLDASNPANFNAWVKSADANSITAPTFGRHWTWATSNCSTWPGRDRDRFTGPYGQQTANPVLVLNPRYDPATPLHGAESASAGLPGSSLVVVEGWGHTTLFTSTCADAIVAAYLLDDVLPPSGTSCPVDIGIPFQADPFSAESQARAILLREATTILR